MSAAKFATLLELLRARGEQAADRRGYVFLLDDGEERSLTYGELWARARATAATLQGEVGVGERVLLLYPPGLDFIVAFMGCLLAGVVAVPAYPPEPARLERTLGRLRGIVADADVSCVLTTSFVRSVAASLAALAPELERLRWLASDELPSAAGERWREPAVSAADIAFLQYTSGSTAAPRGVMISHANLLHNSAAIHRLAGHDESSVYVCWLPSYHDMGLIGGILQPLYGGFLGVLLSPVSFLQQPLRWLRALTRFGATTTPFPNFALDFCVRRVAVAERGELDLSKLQVACNGAEPVRWESLRRFSEAFASCGFRPEAHYPAYGLAEATLLVSGRAPSGSLRALRVDAASLAAGCVARAEPLAWTDATRSANDRTLVGCGVSLPDQELLIVDPLTRRVLDSERVGEIWLRGPSVARGYFRRPQETEETFAARLADGAGPFLRTGDLGFLRDGELYVTGRRKDLIILRGRNLYPQDLELTAERCHARVRPGCVAAFGLEIEGEERLALAAELDTRGGDLDPDAVWAALLDAIAREHDVALSVAVFLKPGSLPKTSSGKLQRRACRDALVAGELDVVQRYVSGPAASGVAEEPSLARPPRSEPSTRGDERVVDARMPVAPASMGQATADSSTLYDALPARLARLERRSTRYRYDLELDVPWARLAEPGLHVGPALLASERIDLGHLAPHGDALELLNWMVAANICDRFIALEEAVLRFTTDESGKLGATRSLELLEDEERKHIAMFRRYGEHLRRVRPELASEADRYLTVCRQRLARLAESFSEPAERHYAIWLLLLFFEEYTVFIYREMLRDAPLLQPVWLAVHRAHAREEVQHVLTDAAYLAALRTTEEQRFAWSRRLFELLVTELSALFSLLGASAVEVCERRYPELEGRLVSRSGGGFALQALLADRAFAQTRAAAPYFAFIALRAAPVAASREARAPSEASAAARAWLIRWLSAELSLTELDPGRSFQSYGLDSVRAIALSGELSRFTGRQLSPTAAYDYPTLELLAEHAAVAPAALMQAALQRPGPLPLNARQTRLVALERAHPGQVLDHISEIFYLSRVAEPALRAAFSALIERHEALRCAIVDGAEGSVQWAAKRWETLPLRCVELGSRDTGRFDAEVQEQALVQDRQPFELGGPLLRATLVQGAAGKGALIVTAHHLICDGWSMSVLCRDLAALYRAALGEGVASLQPLESQPADVAAREAAFLRSDRAAAALRFWSERLAGHPRLRAVELVPPYRGAVLRRPLPTELLEGITEVARALGVTPYIALLTAFHGVLQQHCADDDLLLNTHLFNRADAEERALVGYFVNVLTLRAELPRGLPFAAAAHRVYVAWMEALENALPIDEVVRALCPEGYTQRYMPAASAFNMLSFEAGEQAAALLEPRPELAPAPGFLFFDRMLLVGRDATGQTWLTLWFNESVVARRDAAALLAELLSYLELVVAAPRLASPPEAGPLRLECTRAEIRRFLIERLALPAEVVADDVPLTRFGLDSISAAELAADLEEFVGFDVDTATIHRQRTIDGVARALLSRPSASEQAIIGGTAPSVSEARARGDEPAPLSFSELGLFRLFTRDPGGHAAYNLLVTLRIAAPPDAPRLRQALSILIERHEALRTGFFEDAAGRPRRRVMDSVEPPLLVRNVPPAQLESTLRAEGDGLRHTTFDLSRAPLFAAVLLDAGVEGTLLLSFNHLIVDAWALAVLQRELVQIWRALGMGISPKLAALTLSPSEHARALHAVHAPILARGRDAYAAWPEGGYRLPLDAPLPAQPRRDGKISLHLLDDRLWSRLRAAAAIADAPPAVALVTAFQFALHRHARRDDVAFTIVRNGRGTRPLQNLVAYLSYGDTFNGRIEPGESWAALLGRAAPAVLEQRVERMPYNLLLQPPSMRVVFNLHQATALNADTAPFHYVHENRHPYLWPVWDLFFQLVPMGDSLFAELLYRDEVLRAETIEAVWRDFEQALSAIASDPFAAVLAVSK